MDYQRDSTFDILKGLGIILMVIIHSGPPIWMLNTITSFVMQLFFIASGWFFSERSLDNKWEYTLKKVKGLYFPYLKWSLIFLLLHNVFFYFGVLNNSCHLRGSMEKWYHLNDFISHFVNITILMTGYDNLVGAYWFMRSLFVACLLVCFISWLFMQVFRQNSRHCIIATSLFCCIVGGGISFWDVKIPLIPQGGYRELMATFFVGVGYLLRNSLIWRSFLSLLASVLILSACVFLHPTAIRTSVKFADWLVMIFSGTAGFIITFKLSKYISAHGKIIKSALIYIGKRTFYIMTFHFLMFKPASLFYTYIYDMDWKMIGCHPVIPMGYNNWYWIVYTLTSLVLSIGMARIIEKIPSPKLNVNIIRR